MINGPTGSSITDVHKALENRMEAMRRSTDGGCGWPQFNRVTGEVMNHTEFPVNDDPLRHAEVKSVNQMLRDRGIPEDVSPEELHRHLGEMRVSNVFPHWEPERSKVLR